jgi:NADH-quinone oxidoreductase subunit L
VTTINATAWICLLLPLAAATAITVAGGRITRRQAGYLSTATTMASFAAAVVGFAVMLGESPDGRAHYSTAWTWLSAGQYDFGLTLLTDQLSVFMMLVVAGVGSLIIAYSIGYMDGEDEERRFFAYMSLFVFSMLLLVQSGNLLLLLAGWGMVGLSSYLLIGFYQERPSAVAAAKKAFIINAAGDATVALALFLLIQHTGVLRYDQVFAAAPGGGAIATLVALGLLGGAVAKSAQVPLHTWLPDAMEGPTPVSALIHAATMVVAGVYLLVRTGPLFTNAEDIAHLAAVLGAITLLMAGVIALVQTDIKRVIAYSTMSQIGYMFVGAATGAYPQAMFHLMTHAFFKALLFLAAGIVIHALTAEQDIRRMGGLGRALPYTKWAFLVGSLALVGIPPFSGFFSKDPIIAAQLDLGGELGYFLFVCCIAGAFLTGLYTFRLYFVVFHGERSEFAREHLHEPHGRLEGPLSMIWTVGVLAVLAAFAGWIQFPPFWDPITTWLDPVAAPLIDPSGTQELIASVCAVGLGAAGIAIAWLLYVRKWRPVPEPWPIVEDKFLFDELYDAELYRPAVRLSLALQRLVERPVIAGSIAELAKGFRFGSVGLGRVQNGLVRSYALVLTSGIAVLAVVFIASR